MPMLDASIPEGAKAPNAEAELLRELTDLLMRHEGIDPGNEPGSGLLNMSRQLGSAAGVAIAAAVLGSPVPGPASLPVRHAWIATLLLAVTAAVGAIAAWTSLRSCSSEAARRRHRVLFRLRPHGSRTAIEIALRLRPCSSRGLAIKGGPA
jgi:hypothetical protein